MIYRTALVLLSLGFAQGAEAASIKVLHRFAYTNGSPSHYALGNSPQSELLQASDGNFYGTTPYGGTGKCPNHSTGGYTGCGVIFRMTPAGKVTALYSFPFDTAANSAPNGAFPTAGLIEATDGNLYGVAQDGGLGGCNGALGCGTAFRISLSGTFKRLHQFCGGLCNGNEGGRPMAHLVQAKNGDFYGTAAQGGIENQGTVFAMNAGGVITTLHEFSYETSATDGYNPIAPLLLAPDGATLYGTTANSGINGAGNGGGVVFKLSGTTLTVLHSFDTQGSTDAGTAYTPESGLIFGANGKLYGTTASGGQGGTLYSLTTSGSGFKIHYVFNGNTTDFGGTEPIAGLLLASNGLMYGSALQAEIQGNIGSDGALFSFNPENGTLKGVANFTTTTGAQSRGDLIEGTDGKIYGTTSLYGSTGNDAGSVFRFNK